MYIRFTKSVHLHYRRGVFALSNTHIRPPFRGCSRICGRDKSAPTAADGLPITWRTPRNSPRPPRNWLRNIPSGVGDRFIVPVSWHYQLHIFALPNTHIRPPFCVCFPICGRDKSAPTAANGLPITWRTLCKTLNEHPRNGLRHSARRRGRFIVPVSWHYQLHIFA